MRAVPVPVRAAAVGARPVGERHGLRGGARGGAAAAGAELGVGGAAARVEDVDAHAAALGGTGAYLLVQGGVELVDAVARPVVRRGLDGGLLVVDRGAPGVPAGLVEGGVDADDLVAIVLHRGARHGGGDDEPHGTVHVDALEERGGGGGDWGAGRRGRGQEGAAQGRERGGVGVAAGADGGRAKADHTHDGEGGVEGVAVAVEGLGRHDGLVAAGLVAVWRVWCVYANVRG